MQRAMFNNKKQARCVFIIGFGRSHTTIWTKVINCSPKAYMLSEAYFFLLESRDSDFVNKYNLQHKEWGNTQNKTTYAPFFPGMKIDSWDEWLKFALKNYRISGEKVALSHHIIRNTSNAEFIRFYESNFMQSKFLFTFRDPIQALLSQIKLVQTFSKEFVFDNIIAWCRWVQIWSVMRSIFPNILTFFAESDFAEKTNRLSNFLDLNLDGVEKIFSKSNEYPPDEFSSMLNADLDIAQNLTELYDMITEIESKAMNRIDEKSSIDLFSIYSEDIILKSAEIIDVVNNMRRSV